MTLTLERTVHQPSTRRSPMKYTFPPESKPLEGYTIKRAIHRGGFGEVYYALSDAGKEVALKLLQQNLEIELRGVRQCMNLKHPNLVTIFDIRTDSDGDHWIVMEYVHGKSLDKLIDTYRGPMPMDEVEDLLAGMATGLGFLHDRGIVHRDLKPANVFQENGVVKIGDVGLAKFITHSKRSAQTESVGTVYYMAPEVARGRYGHEVDVYSLGIVLYEMLTGRVPFDGESTAEILMKHLSDKPDLTPLPKRLRPVLAAALEKDPLKRTPSAMHLLSDFRKAVAGVEIPTMIPDESFHTIVPAAVSAVSDSPTFPAQPQIPCTIRPWDRRAERRSRIEARKAARHARRDERRRHKQDRKAEKRGCAVNGGSPPPLPANITPATHRRRTARATADDNSDRFARGLKITAIVVIVLAVVMPRSFSFLISTLFRTVILGGIVYGAYRLITVFSKPHTKTTAELAGRTIPVQDRESRPVLPPSPKPTPEIVKRNRVPAIALTPETLRTISLRSRVSELTSSLAFAVLCTAILTAAVAILSPVVQSPARIALFSVITLLGSWSILSVSKLTEGTRATSGNRRLLQLLCGVVVGAAAFGVQQFLLVGLTTDDFNLHSHGLVHTIGTVNLSNGFQPTLAGYVAFFAGLFVLRHWWRDADSLRSRRVAVWSVLLTTLVGMLLSLVMTFPMMWGVMWAAAISCVVHLSAVWVSPEERRRMTEVPHV